MLLISSVLIGLAVAIAAWAGGETYRRWFALVETDFREKFRRLRLPVENLKTYLLSWLMFVSSVFLVFWILWDMLILGFLCAMLLLALPWYIVRRLAERRAEKIEDQLA